MDEILISIAYWDRKNVPGNFGCEGEFAGRSEGAVLGHEQAAAARDPADRAQKSTSTRHLRMGGHLDGGAHPGKLSGFGDDSFVGLEDELKHRHGGTNYIALHICGS